MSLKIMNFIPEGTELSKSGCLWRWQIGAVFQMDLSMCSLFHNEHFGF